MVQLGVLKRLIVPRRSVTPATAPIGNDKGLPAGGVDTEAESDKLGISEKAAARTFIDGFVDGPFAQADSSWASSQGWGLRMSGNR